VRAPQFCGQDRHPTAVFRFINVPAVIDKALASGNTQEVIVVMPNAFTRHEGSMYSRHTFEIYEGTHTSRIAERVETKTLPFFSGNLKFALGQR
jgi:hypothetical protein